MEFNATRKDIEDIEENEKCLLINNKKNFSLFVSLQLKELHHLTD